MSAKVLVNKIQNYTGHTGSVYSLVASGPGSFLSGSADHVVAEWDVLNHHDGNMLIRVPDIIYSLYHDKENNRMLVGQSRGGIHVINLDTRKEDRLLQYHSSAVFHIGASVIHRLIFSLAGDGNLGIMDADSLELKNRIQLSGGKLRVAALNPAQSLLAIGSADGIISVLSLPSLQIIKRWQAHKENFSVNALHFSPDGKQLLSGSRDAHLNVFDVNDDFRLIESIPAHNYAIYSIAFNNDNSLFATASRDKTIKIWEPVTREVLFRIDKEKSAGHAHSVNKIIWHPETNHLISAGDDRAIMVWEVVRDNE